MTNPKKKKGRGFFALDVHQFERIRALNLGVEEAATYLCLMKSTDQTNVISPGGIDSVTRYSGLTRVYAQRAVKRLEQHGLLQSLEVEHKRARTAPRYCLPIHDSREKLSAKERSVVEAIADGRQPQGKVDLNSAQRAKKKGYIEKRSTGWYPLEYRNEVAFIPNSFVHTLEGLSPLARLVKNGELGPLMLAAELFQHQNLSDELGVPMGMLRSHFSPEDEGRLNHYKLHRFVPGRPYKDPETGETKRAYQSHDHPWRAGDFWADLAALERAHVVEWTVYSSNGRPAGHQYDVHATHRPQQPLGVLRNRRHVLNTPESRPAFLASLLWDLKVKGPALIEQPLTKLVEEWRQRSPIIALENQSVGYVGAIGILRTTHHAATENRTVWYRELCEACDKALFSMWDAARETYPHLAEIAWKITRYKNMEEAILI